MKIKILALLLLICILIPSIVACKKDGTADGETTDEVDDSVSESETKDKYDVQDNLGDVDLGGKEVTIATTADSWFKGELTVEKFNGEIVNDAVYKRNMFVENRLNMKIKNEEVKGDVYQPANNVLKHLQSGQHVFDLVLAPVYCSIINTTKGCWRDLSKYDNIDLSQPYWSQLFNEQISVGNGSQFMATGAISLSYYRLTYVTLVNDAMLATRPDAPNLVEVVNNKDWTIEYQTQLTSKYLVDDGDGIKEKDDTYGFIAASYNGTNPYWSSCQLTMLDKTDDGFYTYAMDKNRVSTVTDQLITLFTADSTWTSNIRGNNDELHAKFAEGTALMATVMLQAVETPALQNMKDEYSILPIPKLDKDQDTYYSFVHDRFTAIAIPTTAPEWECDNFATVMEAMASESYRTVTQSYYEKALKDKYANNPESVEMIDMITQNVYVDAGEIYVKVVENICQHVRNIVDSAVINGTDNTVSSTYNEEWEAKCRQKVADLNKGLKEAIQKY